MVLTWEMARYGQGLVGWFYHCRTIAAELVASCVLAAYPLAPKLGLEGVNNV